MFNFSKGINFPLLFIIYIMLKELIRAIYEIAKAIKSKNNSSEGEEGGGEQSDYKIKLFNSDSEPVGLIAFKFPAGYLGKYYSIEEIFASTPQEIAEIVDVDIEEGLNAFFFFLYENYDDIKQGVFTRLNIHISLGSGSDSDPDYREIAIESEWGDNAIIRNVELDGKTYYFVDKFGGEPPIIEPTVK